MGHCEAWAIKFTGLLNSIAHRELQSLHDYFRMNGATLKRVPADLDALADAVNLHRRLIGEKPGIEARFEPLNEKYRTLEKFQVGAVLRSSYAA